MEGTPPPSSDSPPPGWYHVPQQDNAWRYWDGAAWTSAPEPVHQAVDLDTIHGWLENRGIGVAWSNDRQALIAVLADDSILGVWIRRWTWDHSEVDHPDLALLSFEVPLVTKVPAEAPVERALATQMPIGHLVLTGNRGLLLRWRTDAHPDFITGPDHVVGPVQLLENAAEQCRDQLVELTGGVPFEL